MTPAERKGLMLGMLVDISDCEMYKENARVCSLSPHAFFIWDDETKVPAFQVFWNSEDESDFTSEPLTFNYFDRTNNSRKQNLALVKWIYHSNRGPENAERTGYYYCNVSEVRIVGNKADDPIVRITNAIKYGTPFHVEGDIEVITHFSSDHTQAVSTVRIAGTPVFHHKAGELPEGRKNGVGTFDIIRNDQQETFLKVSKALGWSE